MKVYFYETLEKNMIDMWEKLINTQLNGNPYQLYGFYELWNEVTPYYKKHGFYLGFEDNEMVFAGIAAKKMISDNEYAIEFSHGPVAKSIDYLVDGMDKIKKLLPENKEILIGPYFSADNTEKIQKIGFNKNEHRLWHDATVVIDLTKSEEELYTDLSQKSRRIIRKAIKRNLTFQAEYGKEFCKEFIHHHNELASSRNFSKVDEEYIYRIASEPYKEESIAHIFTVRDEKNNPLSMALIISTARNCFLQRAVSMRTGGETLTEFLHWNIIKWAKSRNIENYDLGGIDMSNENCGVSKFKLTIFKDMEPACIVPQLCYFNITE